MITHCPYCQQEVSGVKPWYRPDDNNELKMEAAKDPQTIEPQFGFDEMVMLRPCEHSFRREDFNQLSEEVRKKNELARELEQQPSSFDMQVVARRLEEQGIKVDQAAELCNQHMDRTPPPELKNG